MPPFRQLPDYDLEQLTDEQLLAHILRARAHGATEHANHAVRHLIWRYWRPLVSFVKNHAPAEAVDEIAGQTLEGALKARFEGSTVEELRGLIYKIARRRIADHYRTKRPETLPFPGEHQGDDTPHADEPFDDPDETERIARWEIAREAFATLSDPHKKVVWLCLILLYDSDSAAKEVNAEFPDLDPPMSQNNVDQIKRRFRKAVSERLHDNEADPVG